MTFSSTGISTLLFWPNYIRLVRSDALYCSATLPPRWWPGFNANNISGVIFEFGLKNDPTCADFGFVFRTTINNFKDRRRLRDGVKQLRRDQHFWAMAEGFVGLERYYVHRQSWAWKRYGTVLSFDFVFKVGKNVLVACTCSMSALKVVSSPLYRPVKLGRWNKKEINSVLKVKPNQNWPLGYTFRYPLSH